MSRDARELFEVRVETSFEAAHRRAPDGDSTTLHHHLWDVAVRARSYELDNIGLVVDFRLLREAVDSVVAELDQRVLEDLPAFAERAATAAAVAAWIFHELESKVRRPRCWLAAVEVEADPGLRFECVADPKSPDSGH